MEPARASRGRAAARTRGLRAHDFHVASLSAAHPLAALLFAPLWGWRADRMDYRILLRAALLVLALALAPIGAVALPTLYLLRMLAGVPV